jgi:hypothetical protein
MSKLEDFYNGHKAQMGMFMGVLLGLVIEALRIFDTTSRQRKDQVDDIDTRVTKLEKATGVSTASSTSTADRTPIGTDQTADIANGSTWLFGSRNGNATGGAPAGGGIPVGITAKKVRTLLAHLSSAMDAGTSIVVTPQYSTDLATWVQIGAQTLNITNASGTGPLSTALKADGTDFEIPADAYVRFQAVATGDPGSRNYAFFLK